MWYKNVFCNDETRVSWFIFRNCNPSMHVHTWCQRCCTRHMHQLDCSNPPRWASTGMQQSAFRIRRTVADLHLFEDNTAHGRSYHSHKPLHRHHENGCYGMLTLPRSFSQKGSALGNGNTALRNLIALDILVPADNTKH
jgi:hypothetical protein